MLKWQLNVRGVKKKRGINITLLCEYIAEIDVNFGECNTVMLALTTTVIGTIHKSTWLID